MINNPRRARSAEPEWGLAIWFGGNPIWHRTELGFVSIHWFFDRDRRGFWQTVRTQLSVDHAAERKHDGDNDRQSRPEFSPARDATNVGSQLLNSQSESVGSFF